MVKNFFTSCPLEILIFLFFLLMQFKKKYIRFGVARYINTHQRPIISLSPLPKNIL